MAVTRSAVKKAPAPVRENPLNLFVWEGTDKRGVKMKGERASNNANFLRHELRKQGIAHCGQGRSLQAAVRLGGKRITAKEIAFFKPPAGDDDSEVRRTHRDLTGNHRGGRKKTPTHEEDVEEEIRYDIESGSSLSEAIGKASGPVRQSCTATWSRPAKARAYSRRCWTPSPGYKETSKP